MIFNYLLFHYQVTLSARRQYWRRLISLPFLLGLLLLVACRQPPSELPVTPTPLTPTVTTLPTLLPPPQFIINETPAMTPVVGNGRPFPSPAYAIHISEWWQLEALERNLGLAREMGFGWVKLGFPWRDIEKERDAYDWWRSDQIVSVVERYGLKLVVRVDRHPLWSVETLPDAEITPHQPPVDYQDYGDFCHELASRYKGRIAAYQVWNEPNLSREWGDKSPNPAEYTALLRLCYEGIKTADPQAIVISAGLAPTGTPPPTAMPDTEFLQGMYAAGAAAYFDVLGVNAPGYKAPPELPPEEGLKVEWGGHRWNVFRHVEDIRQIMVQNGDEEKQIAILEMGWMVSQEIHAEYTWHGVTEEQQAEYLVGAYTYAREHWQPWMGLMTTIYFADYFWTPEGNEQYWWSIVLPDGTMRPAYEALRQMPK